MISYSNENLGKRISATSIRNIIKSYNLEKEPRVDFSKRKSYKRRNDFSNYSQIQDIKKPKVCGCCGCKDNLELHHIIPIYLGGNDEYYNLIYLCHNCHLQMHRMIKTIEINFGKNNPIELENVQTYPNELIMLLEQNRNKYYNLGKKINEYEDSFEQAIKQILRKHNFIVFHFTKVVDENDYLHYGMLNHKKYQRLFELYLKNLKSFYSSQELEEINKKIECAEKDYTPKQLFYTYTKNDVIGNENKLGTLTEFYGGEFLYNILGDEKLKKIGRPCCISFILEYNENDIFLWKKIADYYYTYQYLSESFDGYSGYTDSIIKPHKVINFIYLDE